MGSPYAIEMLNITKRFPGIIANDNITLQLKKGEIHALLGENGAGKSTLMSVLFGLYQPEEGVIKKDGQVVSIKDPNDANALGIGMVHQHFKLVECFTVLDNIIMGVEPTKHGFLQKAEAREKVLALSEKYGLHVDPDALIEDITVGMQQRTEILKALYHGAELLVLDEPSAALTDIEVEGLFAIMRKLIGEGKSIIFISHKMREVLHISDRKTIEELSALLVRTHPAQPVDAGQTPLCVLEETNADGTTTRVTVWRDGKDVIFSSSADAQSYRVPGAAAEFCRLTGLPAN